MTGTGLFVSLSSPPVYARSLVAVRFIAFRVLMLLFPYYMVSFEIPKPPPPAISPGLATRLRVIL